jgi:hypothetical protein
MNYLNSLASDLKCDTFQEFALKTGVCTVLGAVCGYGGTFFFTTHNPMIGASYFAMVALISQIAYAVFEQVKAFIDDPFLKKIVSAIQLLQIPLCFYVLHGTISPLSAAVKLEIITATAYFIAIPIFFQLAIDAWNEPTGDNIVKAMGLMIPLVSGLASYAKAFT